MVKKYIGKYAYIYPENIYKPYIEIDGKERLAWEVLQEAPKEKFVDITKEELEIISKAKYIQEQIENNFKNVNIDDVIKIKGDYEKLISEATKTFTIERWQKTTNSDIEMPRQDEYSIFDKLDEQQIMEEMEGKVITEYFYNFQIAGREVTGISWAGTKAVARYMSMQNKQHGFDGIEIMPIDLRRDVIEDDRYITAVARAIDHGSGLIMTGIARQSKYIIRKDGTTTPDDFAIVKACSKAMRNAIRSLIPEQVILEMYNQWKNGEK